MAIRPVTTPAADTGPAADNLGLLFRRLAEQGEALLRQEVELAKLELRDTATELAVAGAGLGVAVALALAALLAVVAGAVVLLGPVLGSYWGSAFLMAAILLVGAGLTGWRGLARLRRTAAGAGTTARSIKADARWAASEAKELADEVV